MLFPTKCIRMFADAATTFYPTNESPKDGQRQRVGSAGHQVGDPVGLHSTPCQGQTSTRCVTPRITSPPNQKKWLVMVTTVLPGVRVLYSTGTTQPR